MTNLEGRFDRPSAGAWTLAGIGALCLAAAANFFFVEHAFDIAPYPLGGGLLFLGAFAVAAVRAGRFELRDGVISGRRVIGGAFRVPLKAVSKIDFETTTLVIHRSEGGTIALPRVAPPRAAGALWLAHRLGDQLPSSAFSETDPADPRGATRATRELTLASGKRYADRGLSVRIGGSTVYLPTTPTVEAAHLRLLLTLTVGGVLPGELCLSDAPSLLGVPVTLAVAAILGAPLDDAAKQTRLAALADAIGGSVAPEAWEGATLNASGYTARLARAA